MTDQDAFIQAICLDPADDAPRLVYADWLDDHGQGEQAEFIREMCRQRGMYAQAEVFASSFWSLAGRRQRPELAAVIEAELERTLPGLPAGCVAKYSRGFISSVSLPAATFCGGPCGRCDGTGEDEASPCYDCGGSYKPVRKGTGRVEGVARRLFAAHPIERVTLSDKRPGHYTTRPEHWYWTRVQADLYYAEGPPVPQLLPPDLWDLLEGHNDSPTARVYARRYPTEAAALDALSAACVRYGRKLAGLPLPEEYLHGNDDRT